MKNSTTSQKPLKAMQDRHMKPENKDNLDSRESEEQDDKGANTTHNLKETKTKRPANNKQPFK